MMIESRPFASLTSDLLARKGMAKPAMRPQRFGTFATAISDASCEPDLGHADAPSVVAQQIAAIEASFGKAAQTGQMPEKQSKHGRDVKAAFTLRINSERHLKLRLACAVTGRSAQQLLTEALDQMLERKPIVETLARQLPVKASK